MDLFKKAILKYGLGGKPSDKFRKVFYCHVPKCAGTSISDQVRLELCSGYRVNTFHLKLWSTKKASQALNQDLATMRKSLLAYNLALPENYFGSGHINCPPQITHFFADEWDFITIMRNPVDRWISEYVYNTYKGSDWLKNELPLEEYIESDVGLSTGMSYVNYFSSKSCLIENDIDFYASEAIDNLKTFKVVGAVENLDKWSKMFFSVYGKNITVPSRNATPNRELVDKIRSSQELMRKIESICEVDTYIYNELINK
tara:strand:- start:761 stop:1534 length:774 start_codon:yes stop_codon:yes gene_type:complete